MIRLPNMRTVVQVLIIAGVVMWVVRDPHRAASDVSGLGHGIGYCLSQIITFFSSIRWSN